MLDIISINYIHCYALLIMKERNGFRFSNKYKIVRKNGKAFD